MSVLLPNARVMLHVRSHPAARDAWGRPVADEYPHEERGPYDARFKEGVRQSPSEQVPYTVAIDPAAWPVEAGDELTDEQDRTFVIGGIPRLVQVPGHDDVDAVLCDAVLDPPETA